MAALGAGRLWCHVLLLRGRAVLLLCINSHKFLYDYRFLVALQDVFCTSDAHKASAPATSLLKRFGLRGATRPSKNISILNNLFLI